MYIIIGVLALCLIGSFTWIFIINKKLRELRKDFRLHQYNANRILSDNISETKPLIDRYKKELKKKNWKSYNEWYNKDNFKTCSFCNNNSFTIDTDYEIKVEPINYFKGEEVKEYPKAATKRCNVCGTVADEWKCEE